MNPALLVIGIFLLLVCGFVGVPLYFQGIPGVPIPLLVIIVLVGLGVFIGQVLPEKDTSSKNLPGLWDNIEGEVYQHDADKFSIITEQGNFLVQRKNGTHGVTEVDQNGRVGHWVYGSPKQLGEHIKYVVNKRKGY